MILPGQTTPQDVVVPWVAIALASPFMNATDYWVKFCQKNPSRLIVSGSNSAQDDPAKGVGDASSDPSANAQSQTPDFDAMSRVGLPATPTTPIAWGQGLGFFILSGSPRVGVLVINDFTPTDGVAWIRVMREGFTRFREHGVERLILDLSNNGGGYICLAYSVVAMLNPPKTPQPFPIPDSPFPTTIRIDPEGSIVLYLSQAAVNGTDGTTSPFFLRNFLDPKTLQPFASNDTNWSAGAVSSSTSLYSRPVLDNCPATPLLAQSGLDKVDMGPLKGSNITVLTNGFCGSSCAIVSANLQVYGGAQSIFASTTPLYSMNSSFYPPIYSFAGGQVLDSSIVFYWINLLNVTSNPYAPPEFPTSASLSFTYRKLYRPSASTNSAAGIAAASLEYEQIPAKYWIPYTPGNVMRPSRLWYQAAVKASYLAEDVNWNCNDNVTDVTQCTAWNTGRMDGFTPPASTASVCFVRL